MISLEPNSRVETFLSTQDDPSEESFLELTQEVHTLAEVQARQLAIVQKLHLLLLSYSPAGQEVTHAFPPTDSFFESPQAVQLIGAVQVLQVGGKGLQAIQSLIIVEQATQTLSLSHVPRGQILRAAHPVHLLAEEQVAQLTMLVTIHFPLLSHYPLAQVVRQEPPPTASFLELAHLVQTVEEEQVVQLAIEQAVQVVLLVHVPTGHLYTQEPPPTASFMELPQAVQTVPEVQVVQLAIELEHFTQTVPLFHYPVSQAVTQLPPPTARFLELLQAVQTVAEEQASHLAIEQAVQTFPLVHVPTGHLATQEPPPTASFLGFTQAVQLFPD